MTQPATTRKDGPYACNGVLVDFDFNFKVFSEDDIQVVRAISAGVESVLTKTTDYTVAVNADQDASPGGTITTVATYAAGNTITIIGALAYSQPTELTNRGGFFPKVIERALDRLAILIQQVKELTSRSLTLPVSVSTSVSSELPLPSASKFIAWNADADALINAEGSGVPATAFAATLLDDADAAEARGTLEVYSEAEVDALDAANVKLTGNQTIAGVKTFSDPPVLPASTLGLVPPGTIIDFAGTAAPTGYLSCNGSNQSRATYAALFAAIGTTWGAGDGLTTFTLPDFRRRVAVGSGGSGTGTLGNAVGNTGGAETHTLTTAEMPAHTHDRVWGNIYGYPTGTPAGGYGIDQASGLQTGSAGSGGAHNNMQPSAVVLKIIKT